MPSPRPAMARSGAGRGPGTGLRSWRDNADPVLVRTALPGDRADAEARYIEAAVNGIIVTSLYLPNGNPQPGPKFDYKLEWFRRLRRHAAKFVKQDIPVVLAGDYNVAPTALDIYPTRSWDNDALIQPGSRARLQLAGRARLDRRHPQPPPVKADVHVLGLQAKPLATRCRTAARSFAAEPGAGPPPAEGRRRPRGARRGRRQRPCPGMDLCCDEFVIARKRKATEASA